MPADLTAGRRPAVGVERRGSTTGHRHRPRPVGGGRCGRSTPGGPEGVLVDADHPEGRALVSFASNDYLGLTQHPAVKAAAVDAIERWGTGSGAARLVVGSRPVHHDLEVALADWRGTEAALLFPTGFAANLSVMAVFGGPGVRILSDELNHASIIDGCRMARAETAVYRHADAEHLAACSTRPGPTASARTIDRHRHRVLDGRRPGPDRRHRRAGPPPRLAARARRGPRRARSRHPTSTGVDVLRVGTLSKTLGSLGGFVAGPRRFVDLLVNAARPFIFTTGVDARPTPRPPWPRWRVVRSAEGDDLRATLRGHIERIAPGHPSPVIPVVVGDERDAVALSARLARPGAAGAGHPTADRPGRHVPAAGGAVGRPHRPSRSRRWPGALALPAGPTGRDVGPMSEPVPERLVVVVGTGTEVGKTWVAAAALDARCGPRASRVAARKPVQSFDPDDRRHRRRRAGRGHR